MKPKKLELEFLWLCGSCQTEMDAFVIAFFIPPKHWLASGDFTDCEKHILFVKMKQ